MWIVYSLIAAFSSTGRNIFEKRALLKERAVEFAYITTFLSAIISVPFLFFVDFKDIGFWPILGTLLISTFFSAVGFFAIAESIKHLEITIVTPLLVLSPGVTAILAFGILSEKLNLIQILGIVFLLLGSYVLEAKHHQKILDPIRRILSSKYLHLVLLGLVCYSISAIYDRYIFVSSSVSVFDYFIIFNVFVFIHTAGIFYTFHKKRDGLYHGLKRDGFDLVWSSFFDLSIRLSLLAAISLAYVGLALAVRRLSAVFTVIIGGEIFHEKNLVRKFFATLIMIVGTILIAI